nr:unnamed protein product [Callosobruchus chinensis]
MLQPPIDSSQDATLVPEVDIPGKRRRVSMVGSSTPPVPDERKDHIARKVLGPVGRKRRSLTSNDVQRKRFRGGQLSDFSESWKLAGAPQSILQTISAGYTIPFVAQPPLIRFSDSLLKRFAFPGLHQEIQLMLQQGILEVSRCQSGFLSRMFAVAKSDGGVRPVLNLKRLNAYLNPKKFRLLNHLKVPTFLQPNDFLVKLDLSQAYFHVPMQPRHRRFLSIVYKDQILQWTCLPFGLASAPLAFARLSNWVASRLRDMGLRIIVYLDDFLLAHQDPVILQEQAEQAITFLMNLGWKVNFGKSVLSPVKECVFLGLVWNTAKNTVALPPRKRRALKRDLQRLLSSRSWSWVTAKKILGKLNFAAFPVPLGRLHSREMQRASHRLPEWKPRRVIPVPPPALEEMRWWLRHLGASSGVFPRSPDIFMSSDASEKGWGAQIGDKFLSGLWTREQLQWHINVKELMAIFLSLQLSADTLMGKTVVVQSDSRTVVSYIRKQGGTRSRLLTRVVSRLLNFCMEQGITLIPQFLPGMLNNIADCLSRGKGLVDWKLSDQLVRQISKGGALPRSTCLRQRLPG